MTDEGNSHTSILLPSARVALFTADGDTAAALRSLESDWRFARVALEVIEGNVETAVSHYASQKAPDLVIVQTETIDDGFTSRLEALAGHLSEHTAAIVIGPVNDVNLYRKLVGMGVSDYLVKPVPAHLLAEDIARTLIDQVGASDSRLIAVMGAKGGAGATVLTEALAWAVSGTLGQKTFLADAAGGWSTLSVGMNFEPSTTLAEAVKAAATQNEDSLTRMIHQANDKLFVLSTGGDVMLDDSVQPQDFEALISYAMGLYPVVLIDLSDATAGLKRAVLTRAHLTLLVTTPTLPSVRAARTLMQEIKELRGGSEEGVEVVVNMQGYAPKYEVPKDQIEEGLGRAPSLFIPFHPEVFVSTESEAKKLGEGKEGAPIVAQLLGLLRGILTVPVAAETVADDGKKGGIGQLLMKLKKS